MAKVEPLRKPGRRVAAESVFAVLTGASLIGSLLSISNLSATWTTPMWLTVLRLAAAGMGAMLWNRKDAGFRILTGYLLLVFFRLLIPTPEALYTEQISAIILHGTWVFLACYSLGHILDEKGNELFLQSVMTVWALCVAAYCCIAIYAGWTDQKIWNIGGGSYFGFRTAMSTNARLLVFNDWNTSGEMIGLAVLSVFLCFMGSRSRIVKGISVLAFFPCWIALCMTGSRTSRISLAVGIGTAVGILILYGMRSGEKTGKHRRAAGLAAACGAVAAGALCMVLLSGTVTAFNALKTQRVSFVPSAAAEEKEKAAPFEVTAALSQEKAGIDERISITANADSEKNKLSYRWQYSTDGETWKDLTGSTATKKTLKLTVKANTYSRKFRCVVTAKDGTAVSEAVQIQKPYSVKITSKPTMSATGDTLRLTAETEGAEGEVAYQWQISEDGGKTWKDLPGREGASESLTVEIRGEKRYRCMVTADNGTVISGSRKVAEPKGITVQERTIQGDVTLNGRVGIWERVLAYIGEHPLILLTGKSIDHPMKDIFQEKQFDHCHNTFLQTLLESGIPGLLLQIAFVLLTGWRSVRLIRRKDVSRYMRLLPAVPLSILVAEHVECIVRMSSLRVSSLAVLMLYCGVIWSAGHRKEAAG